MACERPFQILPSVSRCIYPIYSPPTPRSEPSPSLSILPIYGCILDEVFTAVFHLPTTASVRTAL
jgi:hypothetical protein